MRVPFQEGGGVRRRTGLSAGALVALLAALWPAAARADEPVAAREPRLMSETAEITSVADAFDGDDPFDLNLVLGFHQSWKSASIRRENQLNQTGLATGGFIPANENIASYSSSTSTLDLGADIGLYKDLALILRLPIILSWSQSLGDLNGSEKVASQRLADPQGGQLFSVPFTSPTRSGIDYFAFGADWAIFNQQRDETKPTWVIGVEGRVPIGNPLHACNATSGTNVCFDGGNPAAGIHQGVDPGISKGFDSILAKTIWSRRFGYVEPYSGFEFQADFPTANSDFGKFNPQQNLSRTPPLLGSFVMGLEVIPFEQREQFQRLSADFRFKGTYHSPGRDYSELFDALGSSNAASLRSANPTAYCDPTASSCNGGVNPGLPPQTYSVADNSVSKSYFTGITEVQAYGSFTFGAAATWQAGEYIKFTLGSAFTYAQSHLITTADPCNPNQGGANRGQAGPCYNPASSQVQGVPNPDHRDIIDLPGHRFSVDDSTIVDLYVMGTVMF
jgi:hypothetical protein